MPNCAFNRMQLGPGVEIFREGEPGDSAYVIESGRIEVSGHRGGVRTVLKTLGAGEMFGELSVIDDMPRSATATTREDTVLTEVRREQLRVRLDDVEPVQRLLFDTIMETFRQEMRLAGDSASRERTTLVHWAGTSAAAFSARAIDRIRLGADLSTALERGEFAVHYQPIVGLTTGQACGAEALVRWRHPERGNVSPGEFIEVAEETGVIVPIGEWVFAEACRALVDFDAARGDGEVPLFMSVNVSARQLEEPGLIDRIADILARTGVTPGRIKLEITESLLMSDPGKAADRLGRLKDLGLQIAIDDFGTGYSSLSIMHRFPLDTLKIDRSFVLAMDEGERGREVVRAICQLAHVFSLDVVAEGIENPTQRASLAAFGCRYGQGYLMARPMPEAEAREFLAYPAPAPSGRLAVGRA